jgi:hypothetical protein
MDYTILEKHFQVLHVRYDEDYVQGFDLAFCRNYYTNTRGLVIFCPESIIYRCCRINLEKAHFKLCATRDIIAKIAAVNERITKYRARGYTIHIKPGMSNSALHAFLTTKRK